ncbi:hypothetical protein CBL_08505 [Carabus blaptoides fortunei]
MWDETLSEAVSVNMPPQLRELFAYICMLAVPPNVPQLFSKYKVNLCEDIARQHEDPPLNIPIILNCSYNIRKEKERSEAMLSTLNDQQKEEYDKIMAAIHDESGQCRCFFLDGPGGSDKTYMYKLLLSTVRGAGDVALATASAGIAANLLDGDRTWTGQYEGITAVLLVCTRPSQRGHTDKIMAALMVGRSKNGPVEMVPFRL